MNGALQSVRYSRRDYKAFVIYNARRVKHSNKGN